MLEQLKHCALTATAPVLPVHNLREQVCFDGIISSASRQHTMIHNLHEQMHCDDGIMILHPAPEERTKQYTICAQVCCGDIISRASR